MALRAESAQTHAALRTQALDMVDSAAVVAAEIDAAVDRIADLAADLEGRINSIRSVARSADIEAYDTLVELAGNIERALIPSLRSRRGLPSPFISAVRTVNGLRAKIESATHIPPDNTEAVRAAVQNAERLNHGV